MDVPVVFSLYYFFYMMLEGYMSVYVTDKIGSDFTYNRMHTHNMI